MSTNEWQSLKTFNSFNLCKNNKMKVFKLKLKFKETKKEQQNTMLVQKHGQKTKKIIFL